MATAIKINKQQVLAFVRKYPVSLGCAGFCILLGVYQFFRSDAIPAAEAELETKTAEAERLALNIKNSAQLREHSNVMEISLKAVDDRMLRVSALATNLQYFYKIEADTGVKLIDLKQNQVVPPKDKKAVSFQVVPYTVSVQGEYARLVMFLRQLENGAHYCRIITSTLSSTKTVAGEKGEDSSEDKLSLTINLELLAVP